jgi:hypothetical protein
MRSRHGIAKNLALATRLRRARTRRISMRYRVQRSHVSNSRFTKGVRRVRL